MAPPGVAGIAAALFAYALLTNNFFYTDTGQILNANNIKPTSVDTVTIKATKHFGLGRYVLAATFIHPHLYSKVRKHTKSVLKPHQSLALIITICLLLSGDIHQCPGPTTGPTSDSPHIIASNHSKSTAGNLQVRTFTLRHTFELNTHLDSSISPASTAGPVIDVDVVTGSTDPSRSSGEFTGCATLPSPPRGMLPSIGYLDEDAFQDCRGALSHRSSSCTPEAAIVSKRVSPVAVTRSS